MKRAPAIVVAALAAAACNAPGGERAGADGASDGGVPPSPGWVCEGGNPQRTRSSRLAGPSRPRLAWTAPEVHALRIAPDGALYLASTDAVLSLDPLGVPRWRAELRAQHLALAPDGTVLILVLAGISGDNQYELELLALEGATGGVKWRAPFLDPSLPGQLVADEVGVYLIGGERLLVWSPGGVERWRSDGAISLALGRDHAVLTTDWAGGLTSREPASGQVRWTRLASDRLPWGPPAVGPDGTVHSMRGGALRALSPDDGRELAAAPIDGLGDPMGELAIGVDGSRFVNVGDDYWAFHPDGRPQFHLHGLRFHQGAVVGGDGTQYLAGAPVPLGDPDQRLANVIALSPGGTTRFAVADAAPQWPPQQAIGPGGLLYQVLESGLRVYGP